MMMMMMVVMSSFLIMPLGGSGITPMLQIMNAIVKVG